MHIQILIDTRCKKGLGIHWGTFVLGEEPINEPPKQLIVALQNEGIREDEFRTCRIRESLRIKAASSPHVAIASIVDVGKFKSSG